MVEPLQAFLCELSVVFNGCPLHRWAPFLILIDIAFHKKDSQTHGTLRLCHKR